ncbi:hypothetical protein [Thermococcus sp.]
MDVREILQILNEKGEVSKETWKPLSVKKNKDGTVDVLYKNRVIGTEDNPVFLWIYANIVEDDEFDVKVLERITFKKEDLKWILRYAQP